jgi:polyhydroxyalkanoate synthesis regulator phasin
MANSPVQQFIDAGAQFTAMSKQQAESLVASLVKSGEMRRNDAEKLVQLLIARGKEVSERINAAVEAEVSKQMAAAKVRFAELETRVEALTKQVKSSASNAVPAKATTAKTAPAEKPSAKKSAAKKAPAKKTTAKKTTAKKSTAKNAPAKKAPAKKAPAKKAVGSSGVRKVSTSRDS